MHWKPPEQPVNASGTTANANAKARKRRGWSPFWTVDGEGGRKKNLHIEMNGGRCIFVKIPSGLVD